jgi:uncharacterized protein YneF (UPF0154 family)
MCDPLSILIVLVAGLLGGVLGGYLIGRFTKL